MNRRAKHQSNGSTEKLSSHVDMGARICDSHDSYENLSVVKLYHTCHLNLAALLVFAKVID